MAYEVPLRELTASGDRLPVILARYEADRGSLDRLFTTPYSPRRRERLRSFLGAWEDALAAVAGDDLSRSDRLDALLFGNLLEAERWQLDREQRLFAEMELLLPFAADLIALEDDRRQLGDVEPPEIAAALDQAKEALDRTRKALEAELDAGRTPAAGVRPAVAHRAAQLLEQLGTVLGEWFGFRFGYDPTFSWWVEKPYRALETALGEYREFLRKRLAGAEDEAVVVGDPLGREALEEDLRRALLPYSPEELIAIGQRELEWCRGEMLRAAGDLSCGDDWRAALEQVKAGHVPPGEQPALIRELAHEAIAYLEEHDLVTVPPLARDGWRMEMMSPEQQKVSPFFLGGETIMVSFPTAGMEHTDKQMSLRGNNRAFSRATVHHELIPGHYLQAYSQDRYRPYRRLFRTPFWVEGWPLYWEMLLWDRGFARTPEERIGMLFWRSHRCARVVFSLRFHLGEMTAAECIELLVNDIGHERQNAAAEVRRSFEGGYDPLYQCAYLIGGLQFRALQREVVGAGRMTDREFHDAVMRENTMPVAALRALLLELPLTREAISGWRFDAPA